MYTYIIALLLISRLIVTHCAISSLTPHALYVNSSSIFSNDGTFYFNLTSHGLCIFSVPDQVDEDPSNTPTPSPDMTDVSSHHDLISCYLPPVAPDPPILHLTHFELTQHCQLCFYVDKPQQHAYCSQSFLPELPANMPATAPPASCSLLLQTPPSLWLYRSFGPSFSITKACMLGQAGHYNNGELVCVPCPVGHYNDRMGSSRCKACPAFTFASELGTASCTQCDKGWSSEEGATTCVEMEKCADGHGRGDMGRGACQLCEPGFFRSASSSSAICLPCSAGSSSPSGSSVCQPCPLHTYYDVHDRKCTQCPPQHYTDKEATIGQNGCKKRNNQNIQENSSQPHQQQDDSTHENIPSMKDEL